jgi:hypothetical protein
MLVTDKERSKDAINFAQSISQSFFQSIGAIPRPVKQATNSRKD